MLRLAAFTGLGLSIGAVSYGHHSAVWVLVSALFSASTLLPAERSTAAMGGSGARLSGKPPEDWLLDLCAH